MLLNSLCLALQEVIKKNICFSARRKTYMFYFHCTDYQEKWTKSCGTFLFLFSNLIKWTWWSLCLFLSSIDRWEKPEMSIRSCSGFLSPNNNKKKNSATGPSSNHVYIYMYTVTIYYILYMQIDVYIQDTVKLVWQGIDKKLQDRNTGQQRRGHNNWRLEAQNIWL